VLDREKNLQDAEIRLEDVPHRECSSSLKQLFGIAMAGVMESTSHPLYFHLLEQLNDKEYFPSIMFPSLPSIYNDREHSLSFLSLFPFEASAMIESTPYLKILHFPPPVA
jgi:hypothetical protein